MIGIGIGIGNTEKYDLCGQKMFYNIEVTCLDFLIQFNGLHFAYIRLSMTTKTIEKNKHFMGFVKSMDLGPLGHSTAQGPVQVLQLYMLSIHANKRSWHSSKANTKSEIQI